MAKIKSGPPPNFNLKIYIWKMQKNAKTIQKKPWHPPVPAPKVFSVAKATPQSQMSVRPSVRLSVSHKAKPPNSLKSSSFILHLSSFIIPPSFRDF